MRPFRFRILLPVLAGILVWSSPGRAADKWLSIRSSNFLLVGNASESSIKKIGRDLEEFRAALSNLFPTLKQESAIGTTVVVFKDDAAFRPYKPLYEGKPANLAGFFQAGEDVNFIALTPEIQSPHVVYHEFVHSLTKDTALPLPPWISEGLAEVYGMFEVTGKEILLGRAIGEHITVLNQEPLLPLNLLLSVKHGSPYYSEKTKQGMFYAESWATVHYLLFGNNGKRRAQLSKYLALMSNGKSIDDNFREAFETDYKTLEEEIRGYTRQQAWPAIKGKLSDKLDFDHDVKVSNLSDAQAQYYVGDLLLHMNRLDAAEAQLQKASALDPKLPATNASLGLLKIRQGMNDEALKFLTQAVEGDSTNHLAHYYYAQMLQKVDLPDSAADRKSHFDLMRTHTLKAIELAPRFTYSYSMLGYIALVTKEGLPEAETAVTKAIEYAPGRMDLRLMLAQLMLSNNETQRAQSVLTGLKSSTTDDVIRYQAEQLLTDIQNRRQFEKDYQAYEQRRREAEQATTPPVSNNGNDEPPVIRRQNTALAPADDLVIETAKPQMRIPEGIRIEGSLTSVDCTNGLTLRVRLSNATVELHTDTPAQLEFVSYVSTVKDTIACGVTKPEIPVAIVYRHTANTRFLGEPIRVEFVNPN